MKVSFSQRELRTVLLGGLFAVVTLWVYSAYLVGPMWQEVTKLGRDVKEARTELASLKQATANESGLREQHQQVQEVVSSLRGLLPAEEELPSVIEFLSDLARQTQVKIQTVFPQRPLGDLEMLKGRDATQKPDAPDVYKEIPVQIDAQGSFHQLGTFLSLVESSDKPMDVSSLRISSNPKDARWHTINMTILTYFVKDEGAAVGR